MTTENKNTALQVTDFDFYGDSLMALKDNATGEIYTAINFVLRGIGFSERQISHNRKKWLSDSVISGGIQNFVTHDELGRLQDTYCISVRKLPLALAKINITPKMKREQPEMSSKLELYQDKCADVLASVFIDGEYNSSNIEQFTSIISNLTHTLSNMNDRLGKLEEETTKSKQPEKKYSRWKTKTFEKLKALLSYTNANSDQNLKLSQVMHLVIKETEDTYDIDISDYAEMYKEEFSLESNPYALDVINHYKNIRDMFTLTLDSTMERLHIQNKRDRTENIFDVLAARLEKEDNNATKSNITSITTNVKKYLS